MEIFQATVLIVVGAFVWYLSKGLDNKKSKKSSY